MKTLNIFTLLLISSFWAEARAFTKEESSSSPRMVGSAISINADFDVYKIDMVGYKPPLIYYQIMPAPEHGVGGRDYTYLGRMPAGTELQIVKIEKSKVLKKIEYWVKPISSINGRLKGSSSRKAHVSDENLDEQIYKLSSIASNVGLYEKGKTYSNGAPKLNETWFTVIKLNE